MNTGKKTIAVTGDVCVDWNIASNRSTDLHNLWKTKGEWASATPEGGAAWLLGRLVEALFISSSKVEIKLRQVPNLSKITGNRNLDHLYNLWSEFPCTNSQKDRVWRVQNYLGVTHRESSTPYSDFNLACNDPIDLLIIDDKTFGYRDGVDNLWPDFGKAKKIIVRMARNLCEGALWHELITNHANKLMVVFTASDLRHSDVRVSRELSWDQTAIDVRKALKSAALQSLEQCQIVLVSFDAAGVLIYLPKEEKWKLVYDANALEGEVRHAGRGRMNGYTYCLVAALVHHFNCVGEELYGVDNLVQAAHVGIAAQKYLYDYGYEPTLENTREKNELWVSLRFPVRDIAEKIQKYSKKLDESYSVNALWANIGSEINETEWSLLGECLGSGKENMYNQIIKEGPKRILRGVPICEFNELLAVERQEIESLHSIRNMVLEYDKKRRTAGSHQIKPLSIVVFGEPGSGKSFAVKQVAKSLKLQPEPKMLEFNLSQLSDPKDISRALHQVRDAVLRGSLPFVFWDEFDSALNGATLGWLKYFLAPMQDGQFQEDQNTHSIGPCVFVFAGGTYHSYADFAADDKNDNKNSKKTDFISRLMGHINIRGINYCQEDNFISRLMGHINIMGINYYREDNYISKVRRAILLRSFLMKHAKSIWEKKEVGKPNIHENVVRAFMNIQKYNHGARSMEAIIVMSRLSGEIEFTPSALPPISQLDIHVDGKKFMELASGNAESYD